MTSNEILKADVLDILFEHRNKDYGAYALRRTYSHRLVLSLALALSIFCTLLFIKPAKNHLRTGSGTEVVVVTKLVPPNVLKTPPPPSRPPQHPRPMAQQKFMSVIRVVDDNKKIDPLDALTNITNVSNKNVVGENVVPLTPVTNNTTELSAVEKKPEETGTGVQREPEFPGGVKAWLKFLTAYLRAPEDMEAGERKTVLIRFKVGTEGAVTDFEVLQTAGRGYDEEVIRVLKKMPKWKPALQNGQPVSRYFTQPVTFMGVEN